MMPKYSQNCWMDWNSAVLCLNFFSLFVWFVRSLLATILCRWEIWSGSNKHVYMYHVLAKKKRVNPPPPTPRPQKSMSPHDYEANIHMTRNRRLFGGLKYACYLNTEPLMMVMHVIEVRLFVTNHIKSGLKLWSLKRECIVYDTSTYGK